MLAEPLDVFGRERVLQKEQLELFHILGKAHRLNRVQPLVNVVQQFHLKAQFCADVRETSAGGFSMYSLRL